MLKKNNFTFKRASYSINLRNSKESMIKRKKIIKKLIPILYNENNIVINSDETAINETIVPLYGYS